MKEIEISDRQRCNHCHAIFDPDLTECPNCGQDDALVCPFVLHDRDWDFEFEQSR